MDLKIGDMIAEKKCIYNEFEVVEVNIQRNTIRAKQLFNRFPASNGTVCTIYLDTFNDFYLVKNK